MNKKRSKKSSPSVLVTAGNQPNPPPKDRLSEVIWMTSVTPEPPLDELFFAWRLVS